MPTETKIIHTTGRNNCGGRCLIHAHVRDGKILRLTTDSPEDYLKPGTDQVPLRACVRGMHYADTFLGQDRLLYPMRRVGKRGEGRFQCISWQEAVDTIASEWIRIRDTYGPDSRYVNYATGVSGAITPNKLAKRLLSLDGGFLDYYNSYSTACTTHATALVYGTMASGNTLDSLLQSSLIILWGHNPADTRFDCVSDHYLTLAKQQGIPIVVVDPRKSDTVKRYGARWIPIRPATDAAMLDAMAYVIYTEGLQDQAFLDRCCLGFDEEHMPQNTPENASVLSYLLGRSDGIPKTPEWAETITGVPAGVTRELAIEYATAKPAAMLQGYGPQRNSYGEQVVRGGILLSCMTGNVGIPGGWAGGVGYCDRHAGPEFPKIPNPTGKTIPVYRWTDGVERGRSLTEKDGLTGGTLNSDIKMILNLAGNCLINQHGDINRTARLLQDESKCEFIVCSDLFMTPSARFADILLPGVSFLESENITSPWLWGDFVGYNNQVVEPLGECRFEYEWLSEVAGRLGLQEEFTAGRTMGDWLKAVYEDLRRAEPELPDFNTFRDAGVYRYKSQPMKVAFSEECRDPEAHPFPTESGKIELYSPKVARTEYSMEFPPIPRYMPPQEGPQDQLTKQYPLQLVGWHTICRCHSTHDNNPALRQVDPQGLWIHPVDASLRGIVDGAQVEIFNDRGRVMTKAKVTEDIMPGVTALSQGSWYAPDDKGVDRNGSINVLTSWNDTPYAHGNAQHTNLVEVKCYTE